MEIVGHGDEGMPANYDHLEKETAKRVQEVQRLL
jgi:hypothetical protein